MYHEPIRPAPYSGELRPQMLSSMLQIWRPAE